MTRGATGGAGTRGGGVERLGRCAEAGADVASLQMLDLSDRGHLGLLAERVSPAVA